MAKKELSKLIECDSHPNVIRYFCMEESKEYIFIALELFENNLKHYVTGGFENKLIERMTVLEKIAEGLDYLHSKRISTFKK